MSVPCNIIILSFFAGVTPVCGEFPKSEALRCVEQTVTDQIHFLADNHQLNSTDGTDRLVEIKSSMTRVHILSDTFHFMLTQLHIKFTRLQSCQVFS